MTTMVRERSPARSAAGPLSASDFPEYWQQRALAAWDKNARRGVIETGSDAGKAYLGVAASISVVLRDAAVLILVPHGQRRQQWLATLDRDFPAAASSRAHGGAGIFVATPAEAAALPDPHNFALLVADECLEQAAALLDTPLGAGCERVLALTSRLPEGTLPVERTFPAVDGGTDDSPSSRLGGVLFTRTADAALR